MKTTEVVLMVGVVGAVGVVLYLALRPRTGLGLTASTTPSGTAPGVLGQPPAALQQGSIGGLLSSLGGLFQQGQWLWGQVFPATSAQPTSYSI